jgi:hypothetical protein
VGNIRPEGDRHTHRLQELSPELVLVDPDLARRARADLPDPAENELNRAALVEPTLVEPRRVSKTVRILRLGAALVVAGTLVTPALALLLRGDSRSTAGTPRIESSAPVRGERREASALAPRGESPKPAAKASARKRPAGNASATKRPASAMRTFVWVPVRGADGYEVQFFRGPRRVLITRTANPRLRLPRDESGDRRGRFVVVPGTYRWYVWPLFRSSSKVRRGEAIVQARLVVSR